MSGCSDRQNQEDGMLKSTMRVVMAIALLVGFTACAKYPMVVNSSAPAPSAAAQPPTR